MSDRIVAKELPFRELLWRLPSNVHQKKGSLLIVGGSAGHVKQLIEVAEVALAMPLSQLSLALPETIAAALPTVPGISVIPLPETQTGSIAAGAATVLLEQIKNHDTLATSFDLSKNPETSQTVTSVLMETTVPTVLVGDSVELVNRAFLAGRKNLILITDMGGIARLFKRSDGSHESSAALMASLYKEGPQKIAQLAKETSATYVVTSPEPIIIGPDSTIVLIPGLATETLQRELTLATGLISGLLTHIPDQPTKCSALAVGLLRELLKDGKASRQVLLQRLPSLLHT